nr:hypothetical protein CFP56_71839 [Quercus suber]
MVSQSESFPEAKVTMGPPTPTTAELEEEIRNRDCCCDEGLRSPDSDGKPRKSPRKPQPNPKYLAILGDKNNKSPAAVQEELMQKS